MDRRTLWAGLVAAVAIACGDAAGELASNSMIETGGKLADAGETLRDSGMEMLGDAADGMGQMLADAGSMLGDSGQPVGDASAQPLAPTVLEGECELETGVHETSDNGDSRIELKLYAEVDVSAYAPEQLIGAAFVLCELEEESKLNPPRPPCDDDDDALPSCVGEYPLPLADCVIETTIEVQDGKARVYCGEHYEKETSDSMESSGHVYESVRLVIPRGAP
jgi:hypothetical protein